MFRSGRQGIWGRKADESGEWKIFFAGRQEDYICRVPCFEQPNVSPGGSIWGRCDVQVSDLDALALGGNLAGRSASPAKCSRGEMLVLAGYRENSTHNA